MTTNTPSAWRNHLLSSLLGVALVASVPLAWEVRQWQLDRERDRSLVAAARISPHVAYRKTREIYVALEERVDVDFKDAPLEQAIKSLEKKLGIPIWPDQRAFDDAGIKTNTPITCKINRVRLATVLDLMLRDLGLTYCVLENALLVTTKERFESKDVETQVYNVADLIPSGESAEGLARSLQTLFASSRDANKRDEHTCYVSGYQRLLVVRTSKLGHRQVLEALATIRAGLNPEE